MVHACTLLIQNGCQPAVEQSQPKSTKCHTSKQGHRPVISVAQRRLHSAAVRDDRSILQSAIVSRSRSSSDVFG